MPSNPRKHKERAQNDREGRRCAEAAAATVLLHTEESSELEVKNSIDEVAYASGARLRAAAVACPTRQPTDDTATAAISDPTWTWRPSSSNMQPTWAPQPERQCSGHGGLDNACTPAPDLAALLQWTERLGLRNHATVAAMQGSVICNNSASLNPPIPDTAFASKMLDAQGRPTYADFAKSVPQENPFTRATAQDAENNNAIGHDGTSQTSITQYNHGCSGS